MLKVIFPVNKRNHYLGKPTGYILIEALIVAALLSVGIFTMAQVQTHGLSLVYGSLLKSKAIILANQMADRVRANHSGYLEGAYNHPYNQSCNNKLCQLAQEDYSEWLDDVKSQLPEGDGIICLTSVPESGISSQDPGCNNHGNVLAIKIWWIEKNDKRTNSQPKSFFYTVLRS